MEPVKFVALVRSPVIFKNCFGKRSRLAGQKRVPDPPAIITANNSNASSLISTKPLVFADRPFENSHIFAITDLHDQISAPHFDFTLQHMVSVFRHPYNVRA